MTNANALTITKRPAKIGSSINTRTEKHGDENVPGCDIPIEGVMLEAEELGILMGQAKAHNALFNINGALQEPFFRTIKPIGLKDKFEDCHVRVTLGLSEQVVELEEVKLANLKLDPQVGGLTAFSFQVQATPETEDMALLIEFMNRDVDVEVVMGKRAEKSKNQPELPMGMPGQDTKPGDEQRETPAELEGAAARAEGEFAASPA